MMTSRLSALQGKLGDRPGVRLVSISLDPAKDTPDVLKHALAAFKKRLKLTKLDDESRLGVGKRVTTGGRKSAVVAIIPPTQYPRAVWDELASQGKLKRSGSGFYELVE
jgi:hypothetical protein